MRPGKIHWSNVNTIVVLLALFKHSTRTIDGNLIRHFFYPLADGILTDLKCVGNSASKPNFLRYPLSANFILTFNSLFSVKNKHY
jgi:hypothetical protein